jgi:hypothetical protein
MPEPIYQKQHKTLPKLLSCSFTQDDDDDGDGDGDEEQRVGGSACFAVTE